MISFDPLILDLDASPDGQPHLVGSACNACGRVYFPRQTLCFECMQENTLADRFLSRSGTLYAYTIVERESIAPKGFEVPYVYGYVDLPEGVRVVAKIVGWKRETLKLDLPVEMVVEPLRKSETGADIMAFRFRPACPDDASAVEARS
jgi:uncharacterized OB-fold protein